MRLRTDPKLRKALHGLYIALFDAKRIAPGDFKDSRLTTIQTAIMGVENFGWRVIGITPEALKLLATVEFNKNKIPKRLCRGHLVDRVETMRALFNRTKPYGEKQFFKIFLENDCTVIMLVEQNGTGQPFPKYIHFQNDDAQLFPNGGLIGWKHRKRERDFLKMLYSDFRRKRCQFVDPSQQPNHSIHRTPPLRAKSGDIER